MKFISVEDNYCPYCEKSISDEQILFLENAIRNEDESELIICGSCDYVIRFDAVVHIGIWPHKTGIIGKELQEVRGVSEKD